MISRYLVLSLSRTLVLLAALSACINGAMAQTATTTLPLANQQTAEVFQGQERARLEGLGMGFASAIALSNRAPRIEAVPRPAGVVEPLEMRHFTQPGMRVTVMATPGGAMLLPLDVELTSAAAVRKAGKLLSELTRDSVVGNFGPPESQSASSVRLTGTSESCHGYIDLGFSGQKLTSVAWHFCID